MASQDFQQVNDPMHNEQSDRQSEQVESPADRDMEPGESEYVVRLNRPLVGFLALALVVLGVGVHFLHGYQIDRNAQVLLRQARSAREAGHHKEAVKHYGQYLRFRPQDTDALASLARVLEKTAGSQKAWLRTFFTFEEVLREDPERTEIRRRIVDVAMRLHRYRDALAHLDRLQRRSPQDPELASLRGQCQEQLGRYSEAADSYLKALQGEERNIEYHMALVRLVVRRTDEVPLRRLDPQEEPEPDAEAVIERLLKAMVEKGRPAYQAYLSRADYYRSRHQIDQAQKDIDEALQKAGDEPDVLLAAVNLAQTRAGRLRRQEEDRKADQFLETARTYAERGLEQQPPDLRFYRALSEIERQSNHLVEAEDILRAGLEEAQRQLDQSATPDETEEDSTATLAEQKLRLAWSLADVLITQSQQNGRIVDQTKLEEARQWIDRLRDSTIAEDMVKFLEGRIRIARRNWYRASNTFEQIRSRLVRSAELTRRLDLLLGTCYEQLQNPDARVDVFQRALDADPLWARGRLELASALADVGRVERAIEEYRAFMGNPGIPTRVARLLILQQLQRSEGNRRWNQARGALQIAAEVDPDSAAAVVLRTEILVQEKKFAEARNVLRQALDQKLDNEVDIWATLAQLPLQRQEFDKSTRLTKARDILDQAEKKLGDRVELRLARAVFATHLPAERARPLLQELQTGLEQFSRDEQYRILRRVARAYVDIGAREEGRAVWRRLAEARPHNLEIRLALVQLAADDNDQQALKHHLQQLRRIEGPGGPNGNYVEARQLIQKARDVDPAKQRELRNRARQLLYQAAEQRPYWAAVPHTLGNLEASLGDREQAYQHYRQALELGDRSREVVGFVVQHLYNQKRFGEADRQLQALSQESPELLSGDLARLAWRVAWRRQQYDKALGLAGQLAEKPKDFRDLIWLGQLRFARGQRGQAVLEPLRRASELAPEAPRAWFALVTYLARLGRHDEGREVIDQAKTQLPQQPPHRAPLTLARCYEMLDDAEQAEHYYQQALQANPSEIRLQIIIADFYTRTGEYEKAGDHLNTILDPATEAPAFAVTWARRRQALMIASSGQYDDTTRALELLEQNKQDQEELSVADLRAKATILANRGTHRDRKAAVKAFEELSDRQGLSTANTFRLGQLYEQTGDWPRGREKMLEALSADPENTRFLAIFSRLLIRHDELHTAEGWINKLSELQPDHFGTVALQARLHHAHGRSQEAVSVVRQHLQQKDEENGLQAATVKTAAELCAEFDQLNAAKDFYSQYVALSDDPEAVLSQAEFLAAHGELDQALGLCNSARETCSPEAVAVRAVSAVAQESATTEQRRRVEQLVNWAREQKPASVRILVALASLRTLQGQPNQAEDLFRKLLRHNPRNAHVLNNLAWLLAVQTQDLQKAMELVNRAIQVRGPLSPLLDTRALVHLRLDQPDKAVADLREAIAASPSETYYFHLALACMRQGDRQLARKYYLQAKQEGFQPQRMHPLERGLYRQLIDELSVAGRG